VEGKVILMRLGEGIEGLEKGPSSSGKEGGRPNSDGNLKRLAPGEHDLSSRNS